MARPVKADRPTPLHIYLPQTVHAELSLLLLSPVEGRVPQGAWSEFFTTLARQAIGRMKAAQPKEALDGPHP